jgi:hypothetical protein
MNVEAIPRFLRNASFREMVWLAPLAYAVHITEEFWRFPSWASTHFAPGFTTQRFVVANVVIMLGLLGLTVLVSAVSVRAVDFVYFCWLSGQLFHNALFHMGTTAYFGVYSPGLLSAILLYLPVCYCVARAAHREGRIGNAAGVAALVVGAAAMFSLAYFGLLRRAPPSA